MEELDLNHNDSAHEDAIPPSEPLNSPESNAEARKEIENPHESFYKKKEDPANKDKVTEVRKGYYALIARIFLISLILDFILFLAIWVFSSSDYIVVATLAAFIIKNIIFVYFVISTTFNWTRVYYQFDEDRLIKITGVYNPQQTVYNLHNLYSVDVHVSILGRIFKYGHITLVFMMQDGEKHKIEIKHVIEPYKCKEYFARYLARKTSNL